MRKAWDTYRQEQIHHVHNDKDEVANTSVVVTITGEEESSGDEVVGEHLPVVLAALLDIDDDDLLQPKGPLTQDVTLHNTVKLTIRPVGPELLHVPVVGRITVEVLVMVSNPTSAVSAREVDKPRRGSRRSCSKPRARLAR